MIFIDISSIFNGIVASFGQLRCFNLPRLTSQHPKVSAVALRLQSTLGAPFSANKTQNVEFPPNDGERPGADLVAI